MPSTAHALSAAKQRDLKKTAAAIEKSANKKNIGHKNDEEALQCVNNGGSNGEVENEEESIVGAGAEEKEPKEVGPAGKGEFFGLRVFEVLLVGEKCWLGCWEWRKGGGDWPFFTNGAHSFPTSRLEVMRKNLLITSFTLLFCPQFSQCFNICNLT